MFLCHLVIFLGLARLILLTLPIRSRGRMVAAICLVPILVAAGSFFTLVLSYSTNSWYGQPTYEWYSVMNIFWTYADFRRVSFDGAPMLGLFAIVVFGLNLQTLTEIFCWCESPPRRKGNTKGRIA